MMLDLSLSTIFILWLFPTYDMKKQIQNSEINNHFNNFANAIKLLTDESERSKIIGFKLLVTLRHQGLYKDEIDIATERINLQRANLQEIYNKLISQELIYKVLNTTKTLNFQKTFNPKQREMVKVDE